MLFTLGEELVDVVLHGDGGLSDDGDVVDDASTSARSVVDASTSSSARSVLMGEKLFNGDSDEGVDIGDGIDELVSVCSFSFACSFSSGGAPAGATLSERERSEERLDHDCKHCMLHPAARIGST